MTTKGLPPDARRTMGEHGADIEALKKRLSKPRSDDYAFAWYSLAGPLYASTSGYWLAERSGRILEARFLFTTTGTSTLTARILKNDVAIGTFTFAAGEYGGLRQVGQSSSFVRADTDKIQVQISNAGAGWEDLSVRLKIG